MVILTGANYDYEPTIVEFTESGLQEPIRAESEARAIFPVRNFGSLDQLTAYWWKQLEAVPINYDWQPGNVQTSKVVIQRQRKDVPVIEAKLNYTYDDYRKIQQSDLIPVQEQTRIVGKQIAINEDVKALIGDTGLGVTSFDDTTNNTTEGSNTGTFADLNAIHTRWSEMNDDLDDQLEYNRTAPRMMMITRDIAKKCRSIVDDDGSNMQVAVKNGLAYLNMLMREESPPGSALVISKYFNGSVSYSEGIPTVTAGTLGVALFARALDNLELLVSNPETRADPVSFKHGLEIHRLHRVVPHFKRTQAAIYEGTYTLT
jgi:3'-phosphoadenosine 5'-phosphosulfate sulfotransferase